MEKKIILGVTGGIAAYKSVDIASGLKSCGCAVKVVMTKNATRFVNPRCFIVPTFWDMWIRESAFADNLDNHIEIALWADAFVVSPATANVVGKFANGIADDLLSTIHLALPDRVEKIMYPAMNTRMFNHPAVQRNLKTLRFRGWNIQCPDTGKLACGETGIGKLPKPRKIVRDVCSFIDESLSPMGKSMFRKPLPGESLTSFIEDELARIPGDVSAQRHIQEPYFHNTGEG